LGNAIERADKLNEIGLLTDIIKDLRAERITFRVLADEQSKAQINQALNQLDSLIASMQQRYTNEQDRQTVGPMQRQLQRYRQDFEALQQAVASRQQLQQDLQQQETRLTDAIDSLQRQVLLRMSSDSQQSGQGNV